MEEIYCNPNIKCSIGCESSCKKSDRMTQPNGPCKVVEELPRTFMIEGGSVSPLWRTYLDWAMEYTNNSLPIHYHWDYIGVDMATRCLLTCTHKNKSQNMVPILSLEEWDRIVNKKEEPEIKFTSNQKGIPVNIYDDPNLNEIEREKVKNDLVNSPDHYTSGGIETIDFIEAKQLDFCMANAVKYISRAGKKSKEKEVEDLEKAVWYLNRKIKRLKECTEK